MSRELRRSRPVREAAELAGAGEALTAKRFGRAVVLIQIDRDELASVDARQTFLSAITQIARFADNVAIAVPREGADLASEAQALVEAIRGPDVPLILDARTQVPDVTLVVGSSVPNDRPAVAINSSGWVARMITSAATARTLPMNPCFPNAIGARGAACLGVGQIFHFLAGTRVPHEVGKCGLSRGQNPVFKPNWCAQE